MEEKGWGVKGKGRLGEYTLVVNLGQGRSILFIRLPCVSLGTLLVVIVRSD